MAETLGRPGRHRNGGPTKATHPAVPESAEELARDAAACVRALGAG
ncbi:MAG TPA: hypothetical protein VII16_08810 [Actinomycetes bacterium]|jgi:uncharacterized protein (DUF849 family)